MTTKPNGDSSTLPSNRKKKNKGKGILIFFIVLLSLICIPLVGGAGLFFYYVKDAPKLDYKMLEDTMSSNFYDMNDNFYLELGEKKREVLEPNQIPPTLKEAIIAIEDKRFDKHMGVDPIRILGAAVSNFKGNNTQGGSTLTQQLIKLSFFSTDRKDQTIKRKAQEAWLSVELEKNKSKDEILTYYINRVYMANGVYGMKTAAETYFGKDLDDLSIAEYALLAGLPQAPNDYNPYTNEELAKKRRDMVLKEMKNDKNISEDEYQKAIDTPISEGLKPLKEDSTLQIVTDNYINEVIKEVEEKTGKNVYTDGLDIYTNVDLEAQTYLYNLMNNDNSSVNFPDNEFQAAATLIDVKNGAVRAEIGGRKDAVQRGNNRAVNSQRNIGSTAKPLVAYAPAIEELNYGSGEIFVDEYYEYSDGTPVYNYDRAYRGPLSMRESLIDSRNIPALKALKEVGTDKSKEMLEKLGIDDDVYEGTAIGMDASVEELAAAYSAFANGGVYYQPTYVSKIVYADGEEEYFDNPGVRAMKETTAYIVTDMLKDVINRGTAVNVQIDNIPQAGKTGTSNYETEAYDKVKGVGVPDITFVGYTPKYSLAVWTGYDDYFQAIPESDQQLAMDIYRDFMTFLYQHLEITDWKQPDDIVRIGNQVYLKGHTSTSNNNSNSNNNYQPSNNYNNTPQAPVTTPSSENTTPSSAAPVETPSSSSETPPQSSTPPEQSDNNEQPTPPSSSEQPTPPDNDGGNEDVESPEE